MAKQEIHDVREYYIMVSALDLNPAATVAVVPIPFSAQVVRIQAVVETVVDTVTGVTFELGTQPLRLNGATVTLSLLTGEAAGTITTREFSPTDSRNAASEGQDGDAFADRASLEIISAGQATATCSYTFMITLRA